MNMDTTSSVTHTQVEAELSTYRAVSLRNVRREIANYKRFKELTMEWIDLSIEKSRLRVKAAADKT